MDDILHRIRYIVSGLDLKTKLLFMMVSLCFLLIAFLFFLYAKAEEDLLEEVKRHTEELSTAIQISIEQISNTGEDLDSFKSLMNIKKKGIRQISVVNNDRDVIASSDARLIGRKLNLSGEKVKNIDNITEYTSTKDGRKRYDILLPVVMGKERLGYIHIETQFDDFALIARTNHTKRLVATLFIFTIGILVAVYLSQKYTSPIQSLAEAAHRVAGGDLSVRLNIEGQGEIGRLTRNFNEMIEKLEENRALQSRLKEAEHMSKIGALASGIAHEVRNPLNFINLSIDHLRAVHAPKDGAQREAFISSIVKIKSEIERLNSMVSNFLNLGRPLNLNLCRMRLEPVLEETIALVSESLAGQKISLRADYGEGIAECMADYGHIKTCFLNIMLNAIQAMPEGGSLTVEASNEGGHISVRITDTGCGIEPENIDRIFEPYFTTRELGIGLGLALTKRIIEEHGGAITVKSRPGQGTMVAVELRAYTGA